MLKISLGIFSVLAGLAAAARIGRRRKPAPALPTWRDDGWASPRQSPPWD